MNSGYILNEDQIRSSLINRGIYKSAIDSLTKESITEKNRAYDEYADTIEQAYISAQQNKNFVDSSAMFRGYKDKIDYDIDNELDKIYSQASEAYQKNIDNIAEKYLSNVNEVSKSVDDQYYMINRYWENHLKYYDEYLRENLIKPFTPYGSYIDSWFDEKGSMKSVDNLLSGMNDEQQMEFLKMLEDVDTQEMLKTIIGEDYTSFSDWLRKNDEKAYTWAISANDLDKYGAETFNKVFGKTSDKFSSFYSPKDKLEKLSTAEERMKFVSDYVTTQMLSSNYKKSVEDITKELYGNNYTDKEFNNVKNMIERVKVEREIKEVNNRSKEATEKYKAPLGTFSK